MPDAEKDAARHGQIRTVDHAGYSVYVCADCGQSINTATRVLGLRVEA